MVEGEVEFGKARELAYGGGYGAAYTVPVDNENCEPLKKEESRNIYRRR